MPECIICGNPLTGKRSRFCSDKCKYTDTNRRHQNYATQKLKGIRRKAKLIMMKGGQCSQCGYKRNFAALCFHHLDPTTKLLELDCRVLSNHSWKVIMTEAAKCILVCLNCHQEIHHPLQEIDVDTVDTTPSEKDPSLSNFCCDCGKRNDSSPYADRCHDCSLTRQTHIVWPPTEELLELLKHNSYLAVGRMLGVSDNAIRKRIKNHPYLVAGDGIEPSSPDHDSGT